MDRVAHRDTPAASRGGIRIHLRHGGTSGVAGDEEREHHAGANRFDHRGNDYTGHDVSGDGLPGATEDRRETLRCVRHRGGVLGIYLCARSGPAIHHVAHVRNGAGDWRGEADFDY